MLGSGMFHLAAYQALLSKSLFIPSMINSFIHPLSYCTCIGHTHTHSPKENSKYLIGLNMLFWTVGCECSEKNKKNNADTVHTHWDSNRDPGIWWILCGK